jgi:hypothetical protein
MTCAPVQVRHRLLLLLLPLLLRRRRVLAAAVRVARRRPCLRLLAAVHVKLLPRRRPPVHVELPPRRRPRVHVVRRLLLGWLPAAAPVKHLLLRLLAPPVRVVLLLLLPALHVKR